MIKNNFAAWDPDKIRAMGEEEKYAVVGSLGWHWNGIWGDGSLFTREETGGTGFTAEQVLLDGTGRAVHVKHGNY